MRCDDAIDPGNARGGICSASAAGIQCSHICGRTWYMHWIHQLDTLTGLLYDGKNSPRVRRCDESPYVESPVLSTKRHIERVIRALYANNYTIVGEYSTPEGLKMG